MIQLHMIQENRKDFLTTMLVKKSTKERISRLGRTGTSYEKVLLRMLDLVDRHSEIKKEILKEEE